MATARAPSVLPSVDAVTVPATSQVEVKRTRARYRLAVECQSSCRICTLPIPFDAVLSRLDGIVLSGGADVDPAEFGQAVWNESVEVDRPRDDWELPLIRQAVRLRTPILAICRGIQSVNVALGGTLVQDLPTQLPTAIVHRQDAARSAATHSIRIHPDSMFANRLG